MHIHHHLTSYNNPKSIKQSSASNYVHRRGSAHATKSHNDKFFGHFQCPKCLKIWKSANAYVGLTQQCYKCGTSVRATKLVR